jgi:hypothetical protein
VTSTINSDKLELIECNGVTSFVLGMLSVRLGEPLVPMVGLGWVGLGWVGLGWVGLGWVGLGWVRKRVKESEARRGEGRGERVGV